MLCQAAARGSDPEAIALLKLEADVSAENDEGETPLTLAPEGTYLHRLKLHYDEENKGIFSALFGM
jgi:hypothetical protein